MKEISDSLVSGLVEHAFERPRGKRISLQRLQNRFHAAEHWCPNIFSWCLSDSPGSTGRGVFSTPQSAHSGHVGSKARLSLCL